MAGANPAPLREAARVTATAVRTEWLGWWAGTSAGRRILPLAFAAAYVGINGLLGGLGAGHVELAASFLGLWYLGPRVRPVFRFLLPMFIVAAVYDGQRYWALSLRGPVHVSEPYHWDLAWFGIRTPGGLQTPAEWCQAHAVPALDLVTGLAYLLFVPIFLGCAGWWEFRDRNPRARQAMWAMLALNLLAYATYLIYPAAPPWYAAHYGLGPAMIGAMPEPGGGLRFDHLLGVHSFANTYGHNANVFGAIPSLHVGQTFLAVLFAWQFRSLRLLTTFFWLLIFFSSVYLNHHYVFDGLIGMAFAAGVFGVTRATTGAAPKRSLSREPPDPRRAQPTSPGLG